MAHHLNTNKQFMRMNFILAFAVIFVVVLFVYMSLRAQQGKKGVVKYAETYRIELAKGFVGDSISLYLNDSLLVNKTINEAPFTLTVNRFDKENTLIIVEASLKTDLENAESYGFEVIREKKYKTNKHLFLKRKVG